MLHKSKISKIQIYTDEWYSHRLSKFTSSGISALMSETSALTYVYKKVGEALTGVRSAVDIDNEYTQWGLAHENEALMKFGIIKGLEFITTQNLIWSPDSMFACTPDGLIVRKESTDNNFYDVSTIEVKCPPTFNNFIKLWLCETPADLKKTESKYYWQKLDQMDNCDCLNGFFIIYHPDFKAGNYREIEFRKIHLMADFKYLRERKKWAEQKFTEVINKMLLSSKV